MISGEDLSWYSTTVFPCRPTPSFTSLAKSARLPSRFCPSSLGFLCSTSGKLPPCRETWEGSQGLEGRQVAKAEKQQEAPVCCQYSCNGVMGHGPGCHRKLGSMVSNSMGYWVVATHFFIFTPKIAEDEPILIEHIFQRGWFNHQLVMFLQSTHILKQSQP